jgi:hypothetical protein
VKPIARRGGRPPTRLIAVATQAIASFAPIDNLKNRSTELLVYRRTIFCATVDNACKQ